ncbi:hypothetical protein MRX96_031201, partial [Rhipicephalus microplus]
GTSSKFNCTTVAISFVVITFLLIAIVFLSGTSTTDDDDEDDLGGSAGNGGGRAGGSVAGSASSTEAPVIMIGNITGMPTIKVITIPRISSTSTSRPPPSASPRTLAPTPSASPSTTTTTPPPVITSGGQTTLTTPVNPVPTGPVTGGQTTLTTPVNPVPTGPVTGGQTTLTTPVNPVPTGPVTVAEPMPSYSYICTVSKPVRKNQGYLPYDGMCDFLFYDSLYKNSRSNLLEGINEMESDPQVIVLHARRYKRTKSGLSFSPENGLFEDYKEHGFMKTIDDIWSQSVSNFGFLDLYREFTQPAIFAGALAVLKNRIHSINVRRHLSHLSYPVRKLQRLPSSFPVAMETLPPNLVRGKDYTYGPHDLSKECTTPPKFADPASPALDEFQLFKPCQDHPEPYYEDPKVFCPQDDWSPKLPSLAYNMRQKKTITYLTETTITQMACNGKKFHLNLKFALAAYDVDFDHAPPCSRLGFQSSGAGYNRVKNTRNVLNFIRNNYTDARANFKCRLIPVG